MKNLPYHLNEYFYFTRLERNATFVLILLCLFFFLLPNFYTHFIPPTPDSDFSKYRAAIAAATEAKIAKRDKSSVKNEFRGEKKVPTKSELFKFNPNSASKTELTRLGLSDRTAQTLINYRSKGGKFFKKEDLQKVYGLRQEDYGRLKDWISIPKKEPAYTNEKVKGNARPIAENTHFKKEEKEKISYIKKEEKPVYIDINRATKEEWQQLRGIGPGYSGRIVNFRDKLGGFVDIAQVASTWGLPDSTFQKIEPFLTVSPIFRKIKINSSNLSDLKSHPYLSNYQATILFNFRTQHGNFTNMESFKKIKAGFKQEDWKRLEKYLSFE